jgi:amino acid adenylation domain-containing protein/FkbM family methyltransferase/non-ribosomal peptide synthase protein (TIGR01720 family)
MTAGYRLSRQQRLAWSGHMPTRHQLVLSVPCSPHALARAFDQIVADHEVLRMELVSVPELTLPLQRTVEAAPAEIRDPTDAILLADDEWARVDSAGLRAVIIPRGDGAMLCLTASGVTTDRPGLHLIAAEAIARASHRASRPPAIQYPQYVEWQHELAANAPEQDAAHWLHPEPVAPPLPYAVSGGDAGMQIVRVPVDALDRWANKNEHELVHVLAAAFSGVLTLTVAEDVPPIVQIALDGRVTEELDRALGPFVETVPLAVVVAPDQTLEAAARAWGHAIENARALLDARIDVGRGAAHAGAALEFFDLRPFPWTADEVIVERSAGGPSLRLDITRDRIGLQLRITHDGSLHAKAAGRVAELITSVLAEVTRRPDASLASITRPGAAMRTELLDELNRTAAPIPDHRAEALFADAVRRAPDAIALVAPSPVTFAELDRQAETLADRLAAAGVGAEDLVGVCMERSAASVAALLGAWKCGAAYLPIDLALPAERIAFLLDDARPKVVIADARGAARMVVRTTVVRADRDEPAPPRAHHGAGPDHLAYVLYTSGSTGRPNGVMVHHRGLVNYLRWAVAAYAVADGVGSPVHSPIAFDLTITSLFTPLVAGRTAELAPDDPGGLGLVECLRTTPVGANLLVKLTPTHLGVVTHQLAGAEIGARVRAFVVGGEQLIGASLRDLRGVAPMTRVFNEYGPTETVVGCCVQEVDPETALDGAVPIGRPIANTRLYVLDENLEPVPLGRAGELHIGGAGVARGYHRRPKLTAARFVPDPFTAQAGARMFRTGDRVRHLPDGRLVFLGRNDDQVKVHGYRIELGEIESLLAAHPAVEHAAVTVRGDRLVAYVVPSTRAPLVRGLLGADATDEIPLAIRYELPDGTVVAHLNKTETEYVFREIFLDRCYLQHGVTLADGDCIIDVGANIGLFTLFASQQIRNGRFYCFEPLPPVNDKLRRNVALHRINATVFEHALGARDEQAEFVFYRNASVLSGRFADVDKERDTVRKVLAAEHGARGDALEDLLTKRLETHHFTVPVRRLSSVIRQHAIEQIDLLKVDVEKSEQLVLDGIDDNDWPKIRQLVVEAHDDDRRVAKIREQLERRGFATAIERDTGLADTGLYNIYAVRPERLRSTGATSVPVDPWRGPTFLARALRQHLSDHLPDSMVPPIVQFLASLPLNSNGKVDRKRLPDPLVSGSKAAPRTPAEHKLADVWCDVLGVAEVGPDDNFFELGGDSILSLQVVAKAERVGLKLTPRQIFDHQTLGALAAAAGAVIPRAPVHEALEGTIPLTPIQRWYLEQTDVDLDHFNHPVQLELADRLDPVAFRQALQLVLDTHDVFRLRFTRDRGAWEARYGAAPSAADVLRVYDGAPSREAQDVAAASLNLAEGRLLRVVLFRGPDGTDSLLLCAHHLIFDVVSWQIVLDELRQAYTAFRSGAAPTLVRGPSFGAFARQLEARGEAFDAELPFWRSQVEGLVPLRKAHAVPADTVATSRTVVATVPAETTSRFGDQLPRAGVRPHELLAAAVAIAVAEWGNTSDVGLMIEGHGRNGHGLDLSRCVGWFTTHAPVRITIPHGRALRDSVLAAIERLRAMPEDHLGYGVLRWTQRTLTSAPEVLFNYLGRVDQMLGRDWAARASADCGQLASPRHRRSYLLELNAWIRDGRLQLALDHGTNAHRTVDAQALVDRIANLIDPLVELVLAGAMGASRLSGAPLRPSDFPDTGLDEAQLGELLRDFEGRS